MITLVSSPKQHLPKDMQHSVHSNDLPWWIWRGQDFGKGVLIFFIASNALTKRDYGFS